jgi:hypothetical protein
MQWRFSRALEVYLRALLDQKLAKPPMAVETSPREAEVIAEGLDRFAICEQEFYGAHISVV